MALAVEPSVSSDCGAMLVWLTGLSGAGKSTIGQLFLERLTASGVVAVLLDGDEIRRKLWPELGLSREDRDQNVRRLGQLAGMLLEQGITVVVAAIAPYRTTRDEVLRSVARSMEIYVHCPLAELEQRDPKGLYRRSREGRLTGLTGVDAPYEEPLAPALRLETASATPHECLDRLWQLWSASQRYSKGGAG